MGYKIEMECLQTEVGEHDRIGYVSGERLPVGHADAVGANWRPVVVEVIDEPEPAPAQAAPAPPAPVSKTVRDSGVGQSTAAKTGGTR